MSTLHVTLSTYGIMLHVKTKKKIEEHHTICQIKNAKWGFKMCIQYKIQFYMLTNK